MAMEKRGQMKPSWIPIQKMMKANAVSTEISCRSAHKIHNANHMEDDNGDLDTPINYSLKYSDEQLNSVDKAQARMKGGQGLSSLMMK